ncbi:type II methionyl aminopeptidase [Candidatus Woesearchaeota archaeon]|nr:type II methionyl aminopeptidase [Candidatus Woesearchaeota archaeon]
MEENFDDWRKAGLIARRCLKYAESLVKPGVSLLEVSEKVDAKIIELGAFPAWPCQISANEIAAHYCAEPNDPAIFEDQLLCIDVGVSVNGAIGDNALSVDLSGKYKDLVKASRAALDNATKILQIGTTLGEIGKTVQETIESYGFRPIKNLCGHGLQRYIIHAPPSIPNFDNKSPTSLHKGQIIAIEPFATNGKGMIHERDNGNLFSVVAKKPVRSSSAREILDLVKNYNGLVFTTRNLLKHIPAMKVTIGLRELLHAGVITCYPPLAEDEKGFISQFENTFLIDDKVEVLTKDPDEE